MPHASKIALLVCPNAGRAECHAAAAFAAAIKASANFAVRAILAVTKDSRFRPELEAWAFQQGIEFRQVTWERIKGRHLQQSYGFRVPRTASFVVPHDSAFDFRDCQLGIFYGMPPGAPAPVLMFAQHWNTPAASLRSLPLGSLAGATGALKGAYQVVLGSPSEKAVLADYLRLRRDRLHAVGVHQAIDPNAPSLELTEDFAVVFPDVQPGIEFAGGSSGIEIQNEPAADRTFRIALDLVSTQYDTLLPDGLKQSEGADLDDGDADSEEDETKEPRLPPELPMTDYWLPKGNAPRRPLHAALGLADLAGYLARAHVVVTGAITDPNDYRIQLCDLSGTPLVMLWRPEMGPKPEWLDQPLYALDVTPDNELWARSLADFVSIVKRSAPKESPLPTAAASAVEAFLQSLIGNTIARRA